MLCKCHLVNNSIFVAMSRKDARGVRESCRGVADPSSTNLGCVHHVEGVVGEIGTWPSVPICISPTSIDQRSKTRDKICLEQLALVVWLQPSWGGLAAPIAIIHPESPVSRPTMRSKVESNAYGELDHTVSLIEDMITLWAQRLESMAENEFFRFSNRVPSFRLQIFLSLVIRSPKVTYETYKIDISLELCLVGLSENQYCSDNYN